MAPADDRTVASLLREYAQRTALRGGNPYRAKAYSRAADSLAALAVPLHVLVAEERLTEVPGVGDAIADIITKLHRTGTHPILEKLRKEIPEGVLKMLSVPGLRPEKVVRLYKDLGIASLAELEAAAKDDRVKKAKGLGAALQTKILQNLAIAKSGEGRLHLHRAAALLEHALGFAPECPTRLKRITVRRRFPSRLRTRRRPRHRRGGCPKPETSFAVGERLANTPGRPEALRCCSPVRDWVPHSCRATASSGRRKGDAIGARRPA